MLNASASAARAAAIAGTLLLAACGDGSDSSSSGTARVVVGVEKPAVPQAGVESLLKYPEGAQLVYSDHPYACRPMPGADDMVVDETRPGEVRVQFEAHGDAPDREDESARDDVRTEGSASEYAVSGCSFHKPEKLVFECEFLVSEPVNEDDFDIEVLHATTPSGEEVSPLPRASIEDVDVSEQDDVTDDSADVRLYRVRFGVENDAGPVGALQFDAQVRGEGGLLGGGDSVQCSSLIEGALASFNDVGRGLLRAAIISLDGIPTPSDVAECTFGSSQPLRDDDFELEVTDAADVEAKPLASCPRMAATRVVELSP